MLAFPNAQLANVKWGKLDAFKMAYSSAAQTLTDARCGLVSTPVQTAKSAQMAKRSAVCAVNLHAWSDNAAATSVATNSVKLTKAAVKPGRSNKRAARDKFARAMVCACLKTPAQKGPSSNENAENAGFKQESASAASGPFGVHVLVKM